MKLFISEMYDGNTMKNTKLGVFSKLSLAERAAAMFFDMIGLTGIELLDWDYDDNATIYYYSHKYSLTITEMELDKEFE